MSIAVRSQCSIEPARGPEDFGAIAELFREYVAWLAVDHASRGVKSELASLPGFYAPPAGELYLARGQGGLPQGCIGIRPLPRAGACELKRLWVRPEARAAGLGRALFERGLAFAVEAGYREVYHDSLPRLAGSLALSTSSGFEPTERYYDNPVPEALFFRKVLR